MITGYQKTSACDACGGVCCKQAPGACFPSDFGGDEQQIKDMVIAALELGTFAIDWWDGDPREEGHDDGSACFVRPATKGREGKLFDPSWGGECTFLRPDGCSLTFDNRPHNCRHLEPVPGDALCNIHDGSKQGAAIAWLPFSEWLDNIELPPRERA